MPGRVLDFLLKLSGPAVGQFLGRCGRFLFYDSFAGLFFFDIWNGFTSWG